MLSGLRPEPSITESRYWLRRASQPWFREIRAKQGIYASLLAKDLAAQAKITGFTDWTQVLRSYLEKHDLTRHAKWKPRAQWSY